MRADGGSFSDAAPMFCICRQSTLTEKPVSSCKCRVTEPSLSSITCRRWSQCVIDSRATSGCWCEVRPGVSAPKNADEAHADAARARTRQGGGNSKTRDPGCNASASVPSHRAG